MESVYQNTFWFAVALLAVLLPLYVLAVSLLGRAIGIAREEKRKIAADQERKAKLETEEASKELAKGQREAALARLKLAEKEEEEATNQLAKVDKRYNLLTLRCCVIVPGSLLLGTASLSAAAGGLVSVSQGSATSFWTSFFLWLFSLLLTGIASYRLIRALQVVQEVSLSSDETALRRSVDAFRIALLEVEEKKRPKLVLYWRGGFSLPAEANAGAEITPEFELSLTNGEVARKVSVIFFAPPGFAFPGKGTTDQSAGHPVVPNHLAHRRTVGDVIAGVKTVSQTTIQCPEETGEFRLYYQVVCEGFTGEYVSFEVNVTAEAEDRDGEEA